MNIIKSKLTKLQIRTIGGNYVRTQFTKLPKGKETEIMVFDGDGALYLGQCTIFGTIIIHESTISNKPLFEYIMSHEIAHSKQWWAIFIIPLIFLIPIGILSFFVSAVSLIQGIVKLNIYTVLGALAGIVIAGFLFAIPCAVSWIMELNADFRAISTVGFETFVQVKKAPKVLKRNFSSRLIILMTHPPTTVTIKIWHRLHKHQGEYSV